MKAKAWPANEPYDRACERMAADDPRGALDLFAAAAKLQPGRARIHANHAWALSRLGRHAKAKVAARKAHELDARDTYVVMRVVGVLFEADDDAVIEPARRALRMRAMTREERRYAHLALCWTLARTSPVEAERETERLVAEWPGDHETLAARACALGAIFRFEEGVTSIDVAIAAAPEVTWLPEALVAFERARELDSDDMEETLRASALVVEATARTHVLMGEIVPIG